MYESLLNFPGGLLAEFERLQQELQQEFANPGRPGSIRALASGAFPALNVGSSPSAIEIYAFAPGLDASKLDVQIDHGLLSISGERESALPQDNGTLSTYANERFAGPFKRTVSLPGDADPEKVQAHYRNGVLHITVARQESAQPKRIDIQ
ncbi:Hsp20/alpha crystallin family protein [Pseudomonas sp. SA3-5]|uniref:Hsp20/alpha crystallin family protein n=1 Tax=Pseudomonas aestuarii TaxID=3018340 RepID=A0ABT4XJM4_9PSED|nr:Hsp20/alpha crystallin family protein [Pseudomonas aestuarii]MDA7088419.1 Hsp20/alpha crystallin family protein [Pseudomonas aestuarii]